MNKTIILLVTLALVTISAAAFCDSPEDAVKGMIEEVKSREAEVERAKIDIKNIQAALKAYYLTVGEYPNASEGLQALLTAPASLTGTSKWKGPYLDMTSVPKDPWGNEYQYTIPGEDGRDFDITIYGGEVGSDPGAVTPEKAVIGLFKAVKAKNWEEAVGYMDLDGIAKKFKEMMDEQTKDLDEEAKKQMAEQLKELEEMSDPKKLKEKFIEKMKEEQGEKDFDFTIKEVKDKTDTTATVVVEITAKKGEEEEEEEVKYEEEFPVIKVGDKWLITILDMDD